VLYNEQELFTAELRLAQARLNELLSVVSLYRALGGGWQTEDNNERCPIVTRVPVYSPYAVAEHAIALLLTLNRKVHRAFNRVRELNFSLHGLVGFDLYGKTAGIVGTGKIGRIVAQILRGFGMRVLAVDPFPNADWAAQQGSSTWMPSSWLRSAMSSRSMSR
jgi:lactate dehydrogenase-like 2-hydroxyacid dehydrogenase